MDFWVTDYWIGVLTGFVLGAALFATAYYLGNPKPSKRRQ